MIRNDSAGEKILYFDCYSGISGDMTLGALLDLGLELDALNDLLAGLKLPGYSLEAEKVTRGGIAGTRALVVITEEDKQGRCLADILDLIDSSGLPESVKDKSGAVFKRLAEAEAAVHGMEVGQVHFHEVGAVDAIVDIVGVVAGLYLLGVDTIYCSTLPAGRGQVDTAHGRLPLPAPATLELLARRNAPLQGVEIDFELVTPTGAAIVAALADSFGAVPAFNLENVGYGAGSFDPGYPNFLRLLLGSRPLREPPKGEEVAVIETTIDDLNPEIYGYLMERLFAAGALDVGYSPIQMKKNRPGLHLTVLAAPEKAAALQDLIFYETSTLGLRLTTACKVARPRDSLTVQTAWGPVRVKFSPVQGSGESLHFAPEYEDCRRVARASGLPLKEVYRLAEQLFRSRNRPD